MTNVCISCKKPINNDRAAVTFPCPVCDTKIVRCGNCRKTSVSYLCACGFEGP